MSSDAELEELRKRRLRELRTRLAEEQEKTQQQESLDLQKQSLLRQILSTEARQRLNRIKLVKPDFAERIELQLIQISQSGRVQLPITDSQLKNILKNLQSTKRKIRFRRV